MTTLSNTDGPTSPKQSAPDGHHHRGRLGAQVIPDLPKFLHTRENQPQPLSRGSLGTSVSTISTGRSVDSERIEAMSHESAGTAPESARYTHEATNNITHGLLTSPRPLSFRSLDEPIPDSPLPSPGTKQTFEGSSSSIDDTAWHEDEAAEDKEEPEGSDDSDDASTIVPSFFIPGITGTARCLKTKGEKGKSSRSTSPTQTETLPTPLPPTPPTRYKTRLRDSSGPPRPLQRSARSMSPLPITSIDVITSPRRSSRRLHRSEGRKTRSMSPSTSRRASSKARKSSKKSGSKSSRNVLSGSLSNEESSSSRRVKKTSSSRRTKTSSSSRRYSRSVSPSPSSSRRKVASSHSSRPRSSRAMKRAEGRSSRSMSPSSSLALNVESSSRLRHTSGSFRNTRPSRSVSPSKEMTSSHLLLSARETPRSLKRSDLRSAHSMSPSSKEFHEEKGTWSAGGGHVAGPERSSPTRRSTGSRSMSPTREFSSTRFLRDTTTSSRAAHRSARRSTRSMSWDELESVTMRGTRTSWSAHKGSSHSRKSTKQRGEARGSRPTTPVP